MKNESKEEYQQEDKGAKGPLIFLVVVIFLGLLTLIARGAGLF